MWARAVWAALVGFVGLVTGTQSPSLAGYFIAVPVIEAKIAFCSEYVFVNSLTPDENSLCVVPQCRNISVRYWAMMHWQANLTAWANECSTFSLASQAEWIGISRQKIDPNPGSRFICGRLSKVFEADHSLKEFSVSNLDQFYTSAVDTYVCSQLTASGSHHDADGSYQGKKLEKSNRNGNRGYLVTERPSVEPTIAPLLWSLGAAALGFCLCMLGLLNLDNERRLLGTALLGIGLVLGCGSLLMWLPMP